MANFAPAFDFMIRNEDSRVCGQVSSEPNGGSARFGINSVFHPEAIKAGFYSMDRTHALEYAQTLYIKEYWSNRGFNEIEDQQIASKLFDMAVNMGNGAEVGILQSALGVPITHVLDSGTKAVLSKVSSADLMPKLIATLRAYYQHIHDSNPTKYANVLAGWLARAEKLPPEEDTPIA